MSTAQRMQELGTKQKRKGGEKPLFCASLFTQSGPIPIIFTPAVTMETGSLPLLGVKRHCDRRPFLTRSAVCVVTSLVFNCKLANKHSLSRSMAPYSIKRYTRSWAHLEVYGGWQIVVMDTVKSISWVLNLRDTLDHCTNACNFEGFHFKM